MHHLAVYDGAPGAAAVDFDLTAAADPVFTQRNGHLQLTDPIQLLAVQYTSLNGTRANLRSPTLNAQTIFNIDPIQVASTQPSPPRVMDLTDYPITIPQDEEIQIKASDTLVGGNILTSALFLAPPTWNVNVPAGMGPLRYFNARVTVTATLVARAWSALAQLTFEQGLRAGIYAVVGARLYCANALFFRFLFPRSTMYNGRALRPGDLCSNAVGDLAWYTNLYATTPLGVWGKFHTFELPQVEIWSSAAAASATYEMRLSLVKIGDTPDPGMLGA